MSHEKPNLALDEGRNTKTTSLSTSVSLEKGGYAKGKKCSLCFYLKLPVYDHYVYKCVNFKTPESKLNKIKEVGGCVKCGYLNHKEFHCKFKFNRACFKCKGIHASYLCSKTKPNNNNNNEAGAVSSETSSNSISLDVSTSLNQNVDLEYASLNSRSTGNYLLPTLTAEVVLANSDIRPIRILYDSGSEFSFITLNLAQKLKYKITKRNKQ